MAEGARASFFASTTERGTGAADVGALVRIEPQPRRGRPFRINFVNGRADEWYNTRTGWPHYQGGGMLFRWRCPFGANGEPVLIDGVWFWRRT